MNECTKFEINLDELGFSWANAGNSLNNTWIRVAGGPLFHFYKDLLYRSWLP